MLESKQDSQEDNQGHKSIAPWWRGPQFLPCPGRICTTDPRPVHPEVVSDQACVDPLSCCPPTKQAAWYLLKDQHLTITWATKEHCRPWVSLRSSCKGWPWHQKCFSCSKAPMKHLGYRPLCFTQWNNISKELTVHLSFSCSQWKVAFVHVFCTKPCFRVLFPSSELFLSSQQDLHHPGNHQVLVRMKHLSLLSGQGGCVPEEQNINKNTKARAWKAQGEQFEPFYLYN